ncbi:MAG: hypothetical protein P1U67_09615 [Alcanivoracaceae bacterium]|nr:hypothetical protein [Alcanivoracaceae bacterium]
MKLIVLLVVLALRRLDVNWPTWMHHDSASGQLNASLTPSVSADGLAWILKILLPAVLVGVAFYFLQHILWGLPAVALGVIVLLWLLGVDSEFRQLDELIVRGRMNDKEEFSALAQEKFGVEGDPEDDGYYLSLCQTISHREAVTLFSSLFFFITLGYGAVLLYVLNRWLAARDESGCEWARVCDAAFYWLPSRLLILAVALGGDFRRVMEAVDGRMWSWDKSQEIFEDAAIAALETELDAEFDGRFGNDESGNLLAGVEVLEGLQSLLLRVLAIWLIFAAIWVVLAG